MKLDTRRVRTTMFSKFGSGSVWSCQISGTWLTAVRFEPNENISPNKIADLAAKLESLFENHLHLLEDPRAIWTFISFFP